MSDETKIALVTGGARRIGRALAEHLAEAGFAVVIHANRSFGEAERLAAELRQRGRRVSAVRADLSSLEDTMTLMEQAAAPFGPIRLLVNNASLFMADDARRFDAVTWDAHFAVHARAPSILAGQLAERMPDGQSGLVVNIIDQRVWKLTPNFYSYTLSKAALWTATRTLAQALAPAVRVNAVGPGPTLANDRQSPDDFGRQVEALILQRGPKLSEFGQTVEYFWNAPSLTGQMIALDGGQHLAWQTPDVADITE